MSDEQVQPVGGVQVQQPQVNLKDWTADSSIMERVKAMEESEMKALLLGLADKPEWIAILRYSIARFGVGQGGLQTVDPIKDPAQMARLQGFLGGIQDLQTAVGVLVLAAKKAGETPTV